MAKTAHWYVYPHTKDTNILNSNDDSFYNNKEDALEYAKEFAKKHNVNVSIVLEIILVTANIVTSVETFEYSNDSKSNETNPIDLPDENGNIRCINCTGCRNCTDCTGCEDCISCRNCTDCTGCEDCISCRNCTDCTGCRNCTDCTGCTGCIRCIGCKNCEDCTSCRNYFNNNPR